MTFSYLKHINLLFSFISENKIDKSVNGTIVIGEEDVFKIPDKRCVFYYLILTERNLSVKLPY